MSTQAVAKREETGRRPNIAKDNWLGFIGDVTKFSGEVRFKSMLRIDGHFAGYRGHILYDLVKSSLLRLSYGMAQELAPKGVAALAITPGFMRTEAILEGFGVTEANWRQAAETNPEAKKWGFIASETPCFVGRAVAALAADPQVMRKSGGVYNSGALAEEYGFTDIDGNRPNMYRYMKEHFPQLVSGKPATAVEWKIVSHPATFQAADP